MRQQSETSGHQGDSPSLALVPFRTLLSEIQLEERLGSGAGGTTWKCRWRTTTVAIKLLISTSVDQLRSSTREAVCSRIVSHPCVVQCYAINIARLTEQDMELLAAAAAPPGAPPSRGGAGGNAITLSQAPPLLCLGGDPPLELCAAALHCDSSHTLFRSQIPPLTQPQYDTGWALEAAGESPVPRRGRFEIGCLPSGQEAAARAVTAAVVSLPDVVAGGDASDAVSEPPMCPALTGPVAAIADVAEGELLLLRAARAPGASALSDRLHRPLASSVLGRGPALCKEGLGGAPSGEARPRRQGTSEDAEPPGAAAATAVMTETLQREHQAQQQAAAVPPPLPPLPCPNRVLERDGSGGGGGAGGAVDSEVAAAAAAAFVRPSSMAWWNDASESLLLELDSREQAAALREELLRLGAAPGKFLTTIIMEWCDGGTLHDEITSQVPHLGPSSLRRTGLASGHLMRGLGPTTYSPHGGGGGGGGGEGGDVSRPRSARVSDQLGNTRRGGGGGSGGPGHNSGSQSVCTPSYMSESAGGVSTSGGFMWPFWGTSGGGVGGGGGPGATGAAAAGSPRSMPIWSRSSAPPVRSLGSPTYGTGVAISSGGGAAPAVIARSRSGLHPNWCPQPPQQPRLCHGRPPTQAAASSTAPLFGGAAPFGSFVVPPRTLGTAPLEPLSSELSLEQSGAPQDMLAQMQAAANAAATAAALAALAAAEPADPAFADAPGAGGASSSLPSGVSAGRSAVLLRCALEVAQGMAYLHSLNLAHGDLTPKNVLLKSTAASRRGYTCKISDFGLSNPTTTGNRLPADTSRWGTLAYLAPEVLTGRGTLKQADVFSFGAVLWHMCCGRPPHQELRPAQLLVGLATGDVRLTWPEWVDPGVARVGRACMDPDPSKRPEFDEIVKMLLAEINARSRGARRRAAAVAADGCQASGVHGSCGAAAAAATAAAPAPPPPAVRMPASPRASSPIAMPPLTAAVSAGGAPSSGSPAAPAWLPACSGAAAAAARCEWQPVSMPLQRRPG